MTVFDLKSIVDLGHSSLHLTNEGMADAYGTDFVFTAHGLSAEARIQQMRGSVSRQLQGPAFQVLRSVPVHGLCATHGPREPAGYRDVLTGDAAQALPCWHSRQRVAQHIGQGQREARLAHLRRLRSSSHPSGSKVVRPRRLWSTTRRGRVCLRFQHRQSVSCSISVGPIPPAQSRDQAPHVDGPTRQYPLFPPHNRGKNERCQAPRRIGSGTRRLLHHGPRLHRLCQALYLHATGAFFVIRAKSNLDYTRRASRAIDKTAGLRSDQTIVLHAPKASKDYPDALRRISYFDAETEKRFVFLTNNFVLPALTIAQLYKCRWQVELFFKWIKQHLRIKAFFGTSDNAVKTQIWIAISVYVLVAILKKQLKVDRSLAEILQILTVCLFEKLDILQALTEFQPQNELDDLCNQLSLFDL